MKLKISFSGLVCLAAGLLAMGALSAYKLPSGNAGPTKFKQIVGADISFIPQLESEGKKFYDKGVSKDPFAILKDHGFNYVRLRIFNDPKADSGYSAKGYCGLEDTKKMALRIKAAGMGFLLDFHYSDTWADPGKQYKPAAWKNLNNQQLRDSIKAFTRLVLQELKKQGTLPDMVQVGNEINHGILWPDGRLKNLDTLAGFLKAGISGVRMESSKIRIMLHIACGGQNAESRYFIDNMLKRGVSFDIIGESYYPEWHGTPDSLKNNLTDLTARYKQDVMVAEYSQHKREVNDIALSLPGNKVKGSFIWEPFSWGETFVDKQGNTNAHIDTYDSIKKQYHISQ
ncbi:glycoside hydrolase family 53 protein [Mucilaginibacter sp. SP1R1]|uniref:glycoside hydrolase family 53 protein n=1 Tax=Mucilaginibacter sp. SP1R1 TaxID=2723091 RepID=UPI001610AC46|nr:glycosyl hydrolase 53 family protein [Mucilaginibacter sp. SP1R1]MBB6148022.1 arabinogalactan endo-1,4-beta-galactosidase [Mucilaginibacter sp. SP1R1]